MLVLAMEFSKGTDGGALRPQAEVTSSGQTRGRPGGRRRPQSIMTVRNRRMGAMPPENGTEDSNFPLPTAQGLTHLAARPSRAIFDEEPSS
jgi:hypothetical protein